MSFKIMKMNYYKVIDKSIKSLMEITLTYHYFSFVASKIVSLKSSVGVLTELVPFSDQTNFVSFIALCYKYENKSLSFFTTVSVFVFKEDPINFTSKNNLTALPNLVEVNNFTTN